MQAIVLDGNVKSALGAVRSLGRAGLMVAVGAERPAAMALHSRYASSTFVYPSPYTDREGFIATLKEFAAAGEKPVVFAFSDSTYLTLFEHREELQDVVTLVFPEATSVEIAFDKAATHSEAKVHGVPVIETHLPERHDEVTRLAKELSYPVVMKPRHSVSWKDGHGVFGSTVFIQNAEELENKFFEQYEKTGVYPLVQPFITGEEYGVEMLADHGAVRALAIHHRIRSLSPTGGASVLKETIGESELSRTMREYSEKLVAELSWHGPIMVEWKVESDSREPLLVELNGRFWGSLPLAIAAGVDFPYLFYRLARGELPAGDVITARPDVTSFHFMGDIRWLLRVLFARDPMRKRLYPSRLSAMIAFFKPTVGAKSDVFVLTDPKPTLMEYVDAVQSILHSRSKL